MWGSPSCVVLGAGLAAFQCRWRYVVTRRSGTLGWSFSENGEGVRRDDRGTSWTCVLKRAKSPYDAARRNEEEALPSSRTQGFGVGGRLSCRCTTKPGFIRDLYTQGRCWVLYVVFTEELPAGRGEGDAVLGSARRLTVNKLRLLSS